MPVLPLNLDLEISPPEFPLALVIDMRTPAEPATSVTAEIYWRDAAQPESEPEHLGAVVAGKTLRIPRSDLGSKTLELFALPRSDKQTESVTSFTRAAKTTFNPNSETLTPVLYESQASTNTRIFFRVGNYTANSKFREVQWSAAADMSSPTTLEPQGVYNEPNGVLDPEISILRSTGLASAETRYVRVRHSSNGASWTDWSNISSATYEDAGGAGGSGGEPPPPTGGTSGGSGCFSGETILYISGENNSLEEIRFSDLYRRNLTERKTICFDESGSRTTGTIRKLFKHTVKEYLFARFSDNEIFEVTSGHKFFTPEGYKPIGEIEIGDVVCNADGSVSVLIQKQERKGIKDVFNMHVETHLNYCVGRTLKRVHNLKDLNE